MWSAGAVPLDLSQVDVPIIDTITALATARPNAPALISTTHTVSYQALVTRVADAAQAVAGASDPGPPIGIMLPNNIDHAVAILACLAAGRVFLQLDPSVPADRNTAILARAGARAVIGDGPIPDGCHRIDLSTPSRQVTPEPIGIRDPAFISATSGSTGQPKLVVHNQLGLSYQARGGSQLMQLTASDRYLFVGAPNGFAYLIHLFTPLLAGAAALLCDLRNEGVSTLMALMTAHRVSILRTGTSLIRALLLLPQASAAFAAIRRVRLIGEPVLAADLPPLRRLLPPDALIMNSYSSTETVPFDIVIDAAAAPTAAQIPSGYLRSGASFAIIDSVGQSCPPGATGELVIRSAYNAIGEWLDGRCVPGRMQPDPADPAQTIYHTGDLVYLREDGALIVDGRIDRQVKINNNRVDLLEVENLIRGLPGVTDAAVLAQRDTDRVRLVAFVVAPSGTAAGIRTALQTRLPSWMIPARIVERDSFPSLPGLKLDSAALLATVPWI